MILFLFLFLSIFSKLFRVPVQLQQPLVEIRYHSSIYCIDLFYSDCCLFVRPLTFDHKRYWLPQHIEVISAEIKEEKVQSIIFRF